LFFLRVGVTCGRQYRQCQRHAERRAELKIPDQWHRTPKVSRGRIVGEPRGIGKPLRKWTEAAIAIVDRFYADRIVIHHNRSGGLFQDQHVGKRSVDTPQQRVAHAGEAPKQSEIELAIADGPSVISARDRGF
jgi:hypothetical protein